MSERELDYATPTRIVLTQDSMERIVEVIHNPPAPTEALGELMRSDDGEVSEAAIQPLSRQLAE